jgi:Raf kinase inhibitor-like YbhB/YbcL family protein
LDVRIVPRRKGELAVTITLSSTAFRDGQPIPKQHTGEGRDSSPPLAWDNLPAGTKSLALICDDPDAPTSQPWVHWLIYRIPATSRSLPEGVPNDETLSEPAGARQGKNSFTSGADIGFRGPMPPPGHGVHHYRFHLYALDAELDLPAGSAKPQLVSALDGHILDDVLLIGTYER